jgi:hypothetical protein
MVCSNHCPWINIDQWLRAHDMVLLLRHSWSHARAWDVLPSELVRELLRWLGLQPAVIMESCPDGSRDCP